jgi:CRISPR-associated endoribonuclease Cas6
MPLKLFLKLKLSEEIDTSRLTPDRLHGLFFSLISGDLASLLHDGFKDIKPFSLFCREMFKPQKVKTLNLEINLLEDSLIPRFLSALILGQRGAFLNLSSQKVEVELDGIISPQKWLKPYHSLVEVDSIPSKVGVKFLSPTTFRRYNCDLPFPLPELLFRGLVKRWLSFSKLPIGVDLREYYQRVEIERYNLKTRKVEFSGGGKLTTFVGSVVYNLSGVEDSEAQRWLFILLRYSLWSGIGRKTTMGLGKVSLPQGYIKGYGEDSHSGEDTVAPRGDR